MPMSETLAALWAGRREPVTPDPPVTAPHGEARLTLDPLLARSPIGVAAIAHDGTYLVVNPAYCALYGYLESEMLGANFTMVFPVEQQAAVLRRHQRYLESDTVGDLGGEWDVCRRDGSQLSVLSESTRILGEQGQRIRLVYVLDITERRRMEQALSRSQVFVRSVLDSLSGQVAVLDERGVVLQVNRSWRARHAAAGGEPDLLNEGADYLAACARAAQGQPSHAPAARLHQELLCLLDGRSRGFEVEVAGHTARERRWFLTRGHPLAGSEPPRFVICCDDVTALRQAQNTLQEQQAVLLDLAASMPGAMFRAVASVGRDWDYLYLSPGIEQLFELTPSQVCAHSRSLQACVHPDDRPDFEASQRQAAQGGRAADGRRASRRQAAQGLVAWEHEFRIVTASATEKWVRVQATPKPLGSQSVAWTGVFTDVTGRKGTEVKLRDSEATFRTLFETVPQGVVYHDAQGRITAVNPAASQILGLSAEQLRGLGNDDTRWHAVHEDGRPLAPDEFPTARALATGQAVKDVLIGVDTPNRGRVWLLVSAVPLLLEGRVQQAYASFEDMTDRVRKGEELQTQARTDFLTGAANRRQLSERLTLEQERVRRHPDLRCAVLMIDIDHFKAINDRHGHAVGDLVLQWLTRVMRQEIRRLDLVARYGGEEFAVLMPDTDLDEALNLAERLRLRVSQTPVDAAPVTLRLTVSIGLSEFSPRDSGAEAVLARADRALYAAKHEGRNQVRLLRAPQ